MQHYLGKWFVNTYLLKGNHECRRRRSMLGREQKLLDKITELVKQIQQFSGNRKKKVRRLNFEVFRLSFLSIHMIVLWCQLIKLLNNKNLTFQVCWILFLVFKPWGMTLKTEANILREIWLSHFVLLSVFCFCSIPVFPLTFFFIISLYLSFKIKLAWRWFLHSV